MTGKLVQLEMFATEIDIVKEVAKIRNKTNHLFGRIGILEDLVNEQGQEIEQLHQILREAQRKTP